MRNAVDPIQLEIIRNALVAAAEEMSIAVYRAGRSNAIREMLDFSTAVFDADGRNIAQAARIPMHLNTMAPCLETILRDFIPVEQWEEGDVVVTNDPYCGGSHLPDILTFQTVCVDGKRVGFTGVMCHHSDIGGPAPGSYNTSATEIYAEGLRIPPLKIKARGEQNSDVLALLLQNVRERAMFRGDLMAQIAALEIGGSQVVRLCNKYGFATLTQVSSQILGQSEAAVRRTIESVPDGEYVFEDFVDDDGINDEPIRIAVRLTVSGDRVLVDFGGTSPQVAGPVNCTLNVAKCAVYYAVIAGLGGEFQANSGCYAPIEVVAPYGSVVNAKSPAAVVNRIAVGHRIVNVILGALSHARPDHIPAAYYGVSYLYTLQASEGTDKGPVYLDSIVGGWGAEPNRDGASSFSCGLHNLASIPIEMVEDRHPVVFTRYALRPNSGGAGKYRGGLGMIREWRLESDSGVFAANFDRFRHPPFGLHGGGPGAVGRLTLTRDGQIQALGSKVSGFALRRGDVITVETSGGGGFGNPDERNADAIQMDLDTGSVSPAITDQSRAG